MSLFANIASEATPVFGAMFAADLLSLFIFLIIVGISSFFQWLKKQKEERDWSQEQMPPRPGAPPPTGKPRKSFDWEEELRRMLEGEVEEPKPRPSAPPVIPPPQRPAPPPLAPQPPPRPAMPLPKVLVQPKLYKAHCDHCGGHIEFSPNMLGESVVCPHCFQRTVLAPFSETRVEQLQHKTELTTLKESAAAFQRASNLDRSVTAHLEEIGSRPAPTTRSSEGRGRSREIQQVVSLLGKPQTARQAMIASVILGPPKALET